MESKRELRLEELEQVNGGFMVVVKRESVKKLETLYRIAEVLFRNPLSLLVESD